MDRDRIVRRALAASSVFNLIGAFIFMFPGSLGQLAGLPPDVPALYRALVALFILLFGGTYGWLARQPEIVRPMVAMAAIGKAAAFVVTLLCWLAGATTGLSVIALSGDLAFAALFAWCLLEPAPLASRHDGARPA